MARESGIVISEHGVLVSKVNHISFGVREGKLEGRVISGKSVDLSSKVIEHSNLVGEVNNLSFRV